MKIKKKHLRNLAAAIVSLQAEVHALVALTANGDGQDTRPSNKHQCATNSDVYLWLCSHAAHARPGTETDFIKRMVHDYEGRTARGETIFEEG